MLKPHHKSYYLFFKPFSKRSLVNHYRNKKYTVEVVLNKIKGENLTCGDYHFLFTKMKESLGLSFFVQSTDSVKEYLKTVKEQSFFNVDYRLEISEDKNIHPWKKDSQYAKGLK